MICLAQIPYRDINGLMLGKLLVLTVVNLISPVVLRNRTKAISQGLAFLVYACIIFPINITVASAWDIRNIRFLYFVGGAFFPFYWMHMLSVGYISKRGVKKIKQMAIARNNQAAQDSLDLAVKLLATGKTEESKKQFNEIVSFYSQTTQAGMAKQYLAELNPAP